MDEVNIDVDMNMSMRKSNNPEMINRVGSTVKCGLGDGGAEPAVDAKLRNEDRLFL